jgi:phage terminase large subunit-like protein
MAPSYEDGIKAVIHKKIKELAPRHLLKGGSWPTAWSEKSRTLEAANGSKMRFFSYEQDVNKMGGDDCDAVYLDEHAPEKMFIESVARTVDRDGYLVLTMTPEAGITWEEEKIIEASEHDPDIAFWTFSTFNNPHLSKDGIAQLEKLITDERLRDAKLYGRFVSLSGLVYPQFDRGLHVVPDGSIDIKPHWHQQFVIDPHHRKPSAMLWTAWDPDGNVCYVHQEAEFPPSAGGVPELAAFIRVKSSGLKIDDWIGDEAMGGEGKNIYGQGSVLSQLNTEGIPVVGTNQASDKAFAAGVSKIRSMLMPDPVSKQPRLYVAESCTKTIKQFMTYQYRKETAVDEELLREHVRNINDDYPTCARYAVMAEVDQSVGEPESDLDESW